MASSLVCVPYGNIRVTNYTVGERGGGSGLSFLFFVSEFATRVDAT